MIPALFVYLVVHERTVGQQEAFAAVSEGAGGEQSVLGPVIAVPFERTPNPARPSQKVYGIAVAYAEEGDVKVTADVTERKRGLYIVPVFTADMNFTARFDPAALRGALPRDAVAQWGEARLFLGVSDTRGIRDAITATANGRALAFEPVDSNYAEPGAYTIAPRAAVALAGARLQGLETIEGPLNVSARFNLSGAGQFGIGPFAKDTRVAMSSNWPDPSFAGGVLPLDHTAGQSEAGFDATWRVAYLARGIPGAGADLDLSHVTAYSNRDMAVRFMREANPYQSVERALKYCGLFVGLVFLAYFLLEIVSGARAHPAQYILVGLAQAVFYLLLLAFAERLGFDIAFGAAATMTVLLTSAYAMSVFRSPGYGLRALVILSGIYGLLYSLMRAEGYALLAGAVAAFTAIALTMFVTRNIDWYGSARAPARS
jgi:inner membrane protein